MRNPTFIETLGTKEFRDLVNAHARRLDAEDEIEILKCKLTKARKKIILLKKEIREATENMDLRDND